MRAGAQPDPHGPASANPGSEFVESIDTGAPKTQMGWEIHPDGLVDVVRMAAALAPGLPIYITENGSAYADVVTAGADGPRIDDTARRDYLEQHLSASADAIAEGLPLKGYFAWSLMDNFEWAFGYSRRFGLVHVDYDTQARTIKNSGLWLAGLLGGSLAHASSGSTDTTAPTERQS